MPEFTVKLSEADLALVKRHAEVVGRRFDEHVVKLLVGSAKAFAEADSVGALDVWTGRKTQHARNTVVDPGADK